MTVTRFMGLKSINASGVNVIDQTSPLQMDGNITIGQLTIPLNNNYLLTNAAVTENAVGDVSINVAAGQNAVIGLCASEYLKEITAFLSTSSVPPLAADGTYADGSGDTPIAKGTKVTGFEIAYSIQGGALTSFTFRADLLTVKGSANANVITSLVGVGQGNINLAATASATSARQTVFNVASPVYDVTDNTQLYIRLNPVTPGGVSFRLYGVVMNLTYNYL